MARRITDDLLLRRSEHNDGSLVDLEEISLHQQHLSKLEYINRVCANLKILYLQDNCIAKIENLGRLKRLETLNLAMNNVEKIENLDGCESLRRLDLTLNFIGDLRSVSCLKSNAQLRELILMGNPCAEYEGYRPFIISVLPHITSLDGVEIGRAERIRAQQNIHSITNEISAQENDYFIKRKTDKINAEREIKENRLDYECGGIDVNECRRRYYQSSSRHTPEYRMEMARKAAEYEDQDEKDRDPFRDEKEEKEREKRKQRKLFDEKGDALNVNQADIEFAYSDHDPDRLTVELHLYKHLDSSLVDLDVQPSFLRATIKGKVFQLRFLEEVHSDRAEAKRSSSTGHLVITAPKVNPIRSYSFRRGEKGNNNIDVSKRGKLLEVSGRIDIANIVTEANYVKEEQISLPALEAIEDEEV